MVRSINKQMMLHLDYVENGAGYGGWVIYDDAARQLIIERDLGRRVVIEVVTPGKLERLLPCAAELHMRVAELMQPDPSGC
jgi:hypothetical protein